MSGFSITSVPPLSFDSMWSIRWKLKQGDVLRLICDLSKRLGLATYWKRGCSLWQWWAVSGTSSCHIPPCSPRETQGILKNIQPCRDMVSVYAVGMPVKWRLLSAWKHNIGHQVGSKCMLPSNESDICGFDSQCEVWTYTYNRNCIVHSRNPGTLDNEARGSMFPGQPWLHSKFQAILNYNMYGKILSQKLDNIKVSHKVTIWS